MRDSLTYGSTQDDIEEAVDPEVLAQKEHVEHTRAEISDTIDAIQERLSPGNVIQGAKDSVKDATVGKVGNALNAATDTAQQAVGNVQDTASNIGSGITDTVRRNPGLALVGLGLGWMIIKNMQGSSSPSQSTRTGNRRSQRYSGSGIKGQMQNTAGQVQNAVGQVSSQAAQISDQAQQLAATGLNEAQASVGQLTSQMQQQGQQVSGTFQQVVQEQPLAVGVGALALGLAVGLSIPETPKENEVFGPARETVMEKAGEVVQETVHKAEKQAQDVLSTAQQSVKNVGSDGSGSSNSGTRSSTQSSSSGGSTGSSQ